MKKLFILAIVALGMLACTDKNAPSNPNAQNGALSGTFSISATKKVKFSQGNLQYQASTNTWRFAEHQWDYVGDAEYGNVFVNGVKCDNSKISDSYDGWIDLFEDYQTFIDFEGNKISNDDNQSNHWRTLTIDEWEYLIEKRSNADNLCGQAIVADVRGFVILPDNWTTPSSLTWQGKPQNWTTNQYSANEWSKMEVAGAVFWPAAGYRTYWNNVNSCNEWGVYWSATLRGESDAYDFFFNGFFINTRYGYPGDSKSVRLINDVE